MCHPVYTLYIIHTCCRIEHRSDWRERVGRRRRSPCFNSGDVLPSGESDDNYEFAFACDASDVEVFCEVQCQGANKRQLSESVTRAVSDNETKFRVAMSRPGEYAFNVYSRTQRWPPSASRAHLLDHLRSEFVARCRSKFSFR